MTVGFSINIRLLIAQAPTIMAMLVAVLTTKTVIIAVLGKVFGISSGTAIRTGITHSLADSLA